MKQNFTFFTVIWAALIIKWVSSPISCLSQKRSSADAGELVEDILWQSSSIFNLCTLIWINLEVEHGVVYVVVGEVFFQI